MGGEHVIGDAGQAAAVEVALAALERRRRDRWIVGAVLVLAVLAALAILLVDDAGLPLAPWAAGGFLAIAALYGVSVAVQEGRARRAVRALIEERERIAALEGEVYALEALHAATRDVAAAEDLPGVFDQLLRGATALTGAVAGMVLLRVGDTLTVATASGREQPEPGTTLAEDDGPAWRAVHSGAPQVVAHAAEWGMVAGASTLAVPLRLPDRTVGALVVERPADAPTFSSADRAAAALFAQQAALAVRNASRLDRADERAAALEQDLDAARADAREAQADAREARADAREAQADAGRTREELAASEVDRRASRDELTRTRTELARTCTDLARALEVVTEPLPALLDELRGHLASVTGTAQLLRHRGDELPAGRRHDLVGSVLDEAARLGELLDRLEQLAGLGASSRPGPVDQLDVHVHHGAVDDGAVDDGVADHGAADAAAVDDAASTST
jgi:K+-sensing histidine kinase KdpD